MMISKHLHQFLKRLNPESNGFGIPSGIASLDKIIHGLRPGRLYLICGPRQVGKTAFAVQMVNSIISANRVCQSIALISLGLSGDQITERLVSNLSNIGLREIRDRELTEYQLEVILEEARVKLQRSQLFIDDSAALDFEKLREKIYFLNSCELADVVFIDGLELLDITNESLSFDRMVQLIEDIKKIAVTLDIPIVVLVNYENEETERKTPQLQDLSGQGINIKHPDVILYLHRPAYYEREIGETDLIMLKNGWGPVATIKLIADLSTQKFKEQLL